jgi:hypothetical protein
MKKGSSLFQREVSRPWRDGEIREQVYKKISPSDSSYWDRTKIEKNLKELNFVMY